MSEIQRYAEVRDGVVENVSLWNGDTFRWRPPEGVIAIPAPDHVSIGWRWDGQTWLEPVPPPSQE